MPTATSLSSTEIDVGEEFVRRPAIVLSHVVAATPHAAVNAVTIASLLSIVVLPERQHAGGEQDSDVFDGSASRYFSEQMPCRTKRRETGIGLDRAVHEREVC
jgi:hypothetical protein